MSRKRRNKRQKPVYVIAESNEPVKFGDLLVTTERRRTPCGMKNIITHTEFNPDTLPKLLEEGIIVQKKEERGFDLSLPLLDTLLEIQKSVEKTEATLFGFITALSVIKFHMYGRNANVEGDVYGVNLEGHRGKFLTPIAEDWPLFASLEDLNTALNLIKVMYDKAFPNKDKTEEDKNLN